MIQSATIPQSELKKKHVAIAYPYVREAIAAEIITATGYVQMRIFQIFIQKLWEVISLEISPRNLLHNLFLYFSFVL